MVGVQLSNKFMEVIYPFINTLVTIAQEAQFTVWLALVYQGTLMV